MMAAPEYQRRDKFDKFTARARNVLTFAQEEATRQNSPIEPPHLILGLVRERNGLAAKALANLGVNLDKLRLALEPVTVKDPSLKLRTTLQLSEKGRRAIELAADEAIRLKDHYIGTKHLLLGTVDVLEESFGLSREKVWKETERILHPS